MLPASEALLVDHPALPVPIVTKTGLDLRRIQPIKPARLSRRQRIRLAVQLTAVTSLLAEFDLWPGRRALLNARIVELEDGLQAVLDGLPRSLSRLWAKLGGGQAAADATRARAVEAIAAASGVPPQMLQLPSPKPGFFLERQLAVLLRELPRPLDRRTARNLWSLRFGTLPLPVEGEAIYWSVPDLELAARFASSMWAECRRRGHAAWVWYGRDETGPTDHALALDAAGTLMVTGRVTRDDLATVSRWVKRPECRAAVLGSFPEGWNPAPPPSFTADRLPRHLALAGPTLDRCRHQVERRSGGFDPLSSSERAALTEAGRWIWQEPKTDRGPAVHGGLARILGLRPEGVPEGFVLVHDGRPLETLRRHALQLGAVISNGRWRLPRPEPLQADPLHAHVAGLFAADDPRRLLHAALATGQTSELEHWAKHRLAELDGSSVRVVLAPLRSGALGAKIHALLIESLLSELDLAGARVAFGAGESSTLKPWRRWLEVADAPRGYQPELPFADEIEVAPRAEAEVALYILRRAVRSASGAPGPARRRLVSTCERLEGAVRRKFELELAALCFPERLQDRDWRRAVVGGSGSLRRRFLHLRGLQLADQGRHRAARRSLALAAMGESSPGRQGFLEVDLGYLSLDRGRSREAGLHLVRAARLLQVAGFEHRRRIVLFNLAVTHLDQLQIEDARGRLAELHEDGVADDPFVSGEEVRLALAVGDEAAFRHRLARYPMEATARDRRFHENALLLRGVAALLARELTEARQLLAAADGEGACWLAVARALAGEPPADDIRDGWGVHRAAELVWLASRGRQSEARGRLPRPDKLRLPEGFALALTERLLGTQPWIDRPLRKRAISLLERSGLTGWAWGLRGKLPDDDRLIDTMARLVEEGSPANFDNDSARRLVTQLGIEGLEARSRIGGQLLFRWGSGAPGPPSSGVRVVLTPLGGEPDQEPSWRLVLGLLDLLVPDTVPGEDSEDEETGFLGSSPAIRRLRRELKEFAPTGVGVLLCGETGVGKDLAAKALHRLSKRSGRFVPVNVAAVPGELLEAELFGSVRGAFTGADRSRRGLVDAADGGTLFLDEIGDLDLSLQVKLLRFLETMELRPLGSDEFHSVDLRVVSATHHDLERRTAEGSFRHDLYYRIAAAPIGVPPLRERRDDIPALRSLFAREAVVRDGLQACRWSTEVDQILLSYAWPGNVRELRHVVEVAMIRAAGGTVLADHLPLEPSKEVLPRRWDDAMAEFRHRFLSSALRRNGGNRSATARELGIARQTLLYHIRNMGLQDPAR